MPREPEDMTTKEWRTYVTNELAAIRSFQSRLVNIGWACLGLIGLVVGQRLVEFLLSGGLSGGS